MVGWITFAVVTWFLGGGTETRADRQKSEFGLASREFVKCRWQNPVQTPPILMVTKELLLIHLMMAVCRNTFCVGISVQLSEFVV